MSLEVETHRYDPTQLFASGYPLLAEPETIKSGEGKLKAGTALGRITADGKWVKSLAASEDGSQVIRGVLAHDVDATDADAVAPVYKSGHFNANAMTFGEGHDIDSAKADLDGKPIFLTAVV